MKKVKIFVSTRSIELEESINQWLDSNDLQIRVKDIRFSTDETAFSALIYYDDTYVEFLDAYRTGCVLVK